MAFSMVAVIILMVSSVAITVITSNNLDAASDGPLISEGLSQESEEMQRLITGTAYLSAVEALNASTGLQEDLQGEFQKILEEKLFETFPLSDGKFDVTIRSCRIVLTVMPGAKIGTELGDMGSNSLAFFRAVGIAEIDILSPSGRMVNNVTVDAPVYCPLPLLKNAWQGFETLVSGGDSLLWQMVRYELAALVQMRVYQGTFSTSGISWPGSVLSEEDVWNAMVLSTLLLQRSTFSQYDPGLISSFRQAPGSNFDASGLKHMVRSEGTVDPADILLRMYGLNEIDLRSLIAQSLYASADLLALRLLEYLNIADIVGSIEEFIEAGQFVLKDIVSFVIGKDIDNQNARNWAKHKFEDASIDESVYRYLWKGQEDWNIQLNGSTIALVNSSYSYQKVTLPEKVIIDVPELDVLDSEQWKSFLRDYELATRQLIDSIEDLVKEISVIISSASSIRSIVLELDPYDGTGFFEEISASITSALADSSGYFTNSATKLDIEEGKDPMGVSIMASIKERSDDFFRRESKLSAAMDDLAGSIYDDILTRYPSFSDAPHEMNTKTIREYLVQSEHQSIGAQMDSSYQNDVFIIIATIETGLTFPSQGSTSFWGNIVRVMVDGGMIGLLGMEGWIESNVLEMVEDMSASNDLRGGNISLPLPTERSMSVSNLAGKTSIVDLKIWTELEDGLLINVMDPIENMAGRVNPNSHITDLMDGSMSPFINCWSYSVECHFRMKLSLQSGTGAVAESYEGFAYSGASSEVSASSGWPLIGVGYEPTNTLQGDALAILNEIYKAFKDGLRSLGRTVSDVYELVQSLRSQSIEVISRGMEFAAAAVSSSLGALQDLLRALVLGCSCALIESLTEGRNVELLEMKLLGVSLSIELNNRDNSLAGAKSIVKVMFSFAMGDATYGIAGRLYRDLTGEYGFLMNASIRSDQSKLLMVIDPFMASYPHVLEARGWINGNYIDLCIPEIVRYRQIGFSLADLPGVGNVLSNIPLPLPGVKGQVNAGIFVKLATESKMGPVINEFELNPKGVDAGKEWVEIFNPSGQVVSLSGWTIETMHGKKVVDELGDILLTPYSRTVYEFQAQALDNGGPGNLPDGESLVLRDATGRRVDTAPFVPDVKNDGRTWQRSHDGSESWEFRKGTKGAANSASITKWVSGADATVTLEGIMVEALEVLEASGSSLSSLSNAIGTSMRNALTAIIEDFSGALIEVGLYFEISIVEESGSVGATTRYSLTTDGSIAMDAWTWMCGAMQDMILDSTSSMRSVGTFACAEFLCEDVWFGLSNGVKAKLPKLLGTKQSISCKANVVVKVNIAAAGVIFGEDLGTPKMNFGMQLTGVLSDNIPLIGLQVGEQVDLWLVRGTLTAPE